MSPRQDGREHEKIKRVRAWGGACGCGSGAGRSAVCATRLKRKAAGAFSVLGGYFEAFTSKPKDR